MCAVVHEAKALKYIKGWLFTTEISGRNYSHIYQYVFSQRWTRQNWDSSQLHDAQALAWTLKSAIWSCSDNKAGSDAPRANRLRSAERRVFDQCALNPDYLSALVSGLISVTPEPLSTSRDPSSALNLRHMTMAESITVAGSTHSCWGGKTGVPRLRFQKWDDAVQPGLKAQSQYFFFSVPIRRNVGDYYKKCANFWTTSSQ